MNRLASFLILLTISLWIVSCGGHGGGIVPPPGNRDVSGTVTDSQGRPVPGLSVLIDGKSTGITTTSTGTFVVPKAQFSQGMSASYRVAVGKGGVVFNETFFTPSSNGNLDIRFASSTGTEGNLHGTVYDERTSGTLSDVLIIAFANEGGLFYAMSDASGAYSLDIPAGNWLLLSWKNDYNPGVMTVEVQEGGESFQDVYLSPVGPPQPPAGIHISGTVTDEKSGNPVEGALVSMTVDTGILWAETGGPVPPAQGGGGSTGSSGGTETRPPAQAGSDAMPMPPYFPSYQETYTDAAGHYDFADDAVGFSAYLTVSADNYMPTNKTQDLSGAADALTIDLTIKPLVLTTVSGKVLDGDGNPVPSANVEFIYQGEYGGGGWVLPMDGGPAGMKDWVDQAQNSAGDATGGGAGWDMPMGAPAPTAGESAGNDNYDNPMFMKYLYEHRNDKGASQSAPPPGPYYFTGYYSAQTDVNGDFFVPDIAAGPYIVFASAYGFLPYSGNSDVAEDGSTVLNVTLEAVPVGSVEGTVKDTDGNPIPDVLVNCVQPNQDPFGFTDAAGHYKLENVPVGQWTVGAYALGYRAQTVSVSIPENDTLGISFELEKYTPPQVDKVFYTGTVIDGTTGTPVKGAGLSVVSSDNQYWDTGTTDSAGVFTMNLVPTDYSIDIEVAGYQNLYTRFWVDSSYPQMEFYIWPVGSGMGGGWGGISVPGKPGGSEPGGGGGTTPPSQPPDGGGIGL